MNRTKKLATSLLITAAFGTAFSSTQVLANEVCAHGHSGHFEKRDRIADHRGYGMDFLAYVGAVSQGDWLHYTIPVDSSKGVKAIKFQWYNYSNQVSIRNVHIYRGATRIKTFDNIYLGNGTTGWHDSTVDLGGTFSFNKGLGVTLMTDSGVDGNKRVIIGSICAVLQ